MKENISYEEGLTNFIKDYKPTRARNYITTSWLYIKSEPSNGKMELFAEKGVPLVIIH